MPMVNRQLAGDDGGLVAGTVVDDVQQIRARGGVSCTYDPVIEYQHVDFGELMRPFSKGAATVPDAQFFL